MKRTLSHLAVLTSVLAAAGALQAQEAKLSARMDVWYTQMLDNNLRRNSEYAGKYYQWNSAFKENGFSVRRMEIWLKGTVTPDVAYTFFLDPSASTSSAPSPLTSTSYSGYNPSIVVDAFIDWKLAPQLTLRVGQFKPGQTFEAINQTIAEMLFYDRSMLARQFGDKRDRGLGLTYAMGQASGLNAKATVGVSNGTSDFDGGKANDRNAQKDYWARLEMAYGPDHRFGAYYRQGETDLSDKGSLYARAWTAGDAPAAAAILQDRDKTTNLGAYYTFETKRWYASAEAITGLLGRRVPSLAESASQASLRQALDQKYLGATLSGAYKMGRHWITARYDYMNYNLGDRHYGAADPYKVNGADYTPRYFEAIAGYNYLFDPAKPVAGKMKVNYIHRSKNFLQPRQGQAGEQGGDSIVVSFQFGF
jgi:hypothetical protein